MHGSFVTNKDPLLKEGTVVMSILEVTTDIKYYLVGQHAIKSTYDFFVDIE